MKIQKETKWLCENARNLERFSGKWVMFSTHEGVVSKGASLDHVLKSARRKRSSKSPYVFHVPSKDELGIPLPGVKSN